MTTVQTGASKDSAAKDTKDKHTRPSDAGKPAEAAAKADPAPTATTAPTLPPASGQRVAAPASAATTPALPIDVTSLADDVLPVLIAAAQREWDQRRAKRKTEILALVGTRFAALIAEALDAGLDHDTIGNSLSKHLRGGKRASGRTPSGVMDGRKNVPPLFRDPVSGETWAGRGKPKAWVQFGDDINPKTGKPLPLRKFWISEQERQSPPSP